MNMRETRMRVVCIVVRVCFPLAILVLLCSSVVGESSQESRMSLAGPSSVSEIEKAYDAMELALINRLRNQEATNSTEVAKTIDALGHIRSKKAIPLLLEMLEYNRRTGKVVLLNGVEIRVAGGGTFRHAYVAVGALIDIGVPLDRCIEEIEKAKDGSLRERLLTKLAYECHGQAFADRVRDRLSNSASGGKKKWEHVLSILPQREMVTGK